MSLIVHLIDDLGTPFAVWRDTERTLKMRNNLLRYDAAIECPSLEIAPPCSDLDEANSALNGAIRMQVL